MSEKLNQNEIISFLVDVGGDALFVGETLIHGFSKELGDFALTIAQSGERSDARSNAQKGKQQQNAFHNWSFRICSTLSWVAWSHFHCARAGASCRVQKTEHEQIVDVRRRIFNCDV